MKLKRKIFNIFAAVVMVFGSFPITFLNTYAEGESPAGEVPKSSKTVTPNGDGTYDITIKIDGTSSEQTDVTKANVVVVLDTSGSMDEPTVFNGNSTGRYGLVDGSYVNLYRYNGGLFGGSCDRIENDSTSGTVYSDSSCDDRYTGARYIGSGPTRMDVAKDAVSDLAEQLLSENDSSNPDMVEMAFIDFATDINENKTPTTSLSTFQGWIDDTDVSTGSNGGTNWEAALTAAKNVSFGEGDTDKTYVIFVSDGDPTFRVSRYGGNNNECFRRNWQNQCVIYGNGHDDPSPYRNFNAAKDVADDIVDSGKDLFAVGAFGNVSNMENLGGTYYDASNKEALNTAFADIVDKITKGLSIADLEITDGVTSAASVPVPEHATAGAFRYSFSPSDDIWGEPGTGFAEAYFDEATRSVHWDPSIKDENGEYIKHNTLSNGQSASVTFTVWPSQEAMDCIAALRNKDEGVCSEDNLEEFGLKKEGNNFSLITNTEASFKYKTVTTVEGKDPVYSDFYEVEIEEPEYDSVLPETTLQVKKKWFDTMGSQLGDIEGVSIKLYIDKEENPDPVRTYTFNSENVDPEDEKQWIGTDDKNGESEYTVAPGVMKELRVLEDGTPDPETAGLENIAIKVVKVGDKRYAVLEEGYSYEFDGEVVDYSGSTNHYHITKREYHPMIVDDGEIHNVIFNDDATGDSEETAVIEEEPLESLAVENTLNGGILVFKVVKNNGELDETVEDEYEITISNIKDAEGNLLSHTEENPMRYRIMNCSVDDGEEGYEEDCSPADDTKTPFYDGTFTTTIKVNQGILIGDLPTGSTFEVEETQPEGYGTPSIDYRLVQYNAEGEREILDEEDGSEYIQTVFGNSSAQAIITNTLESGDLKVSKEVTATSGDLTQAQGKVFNFTVNFYKSQDSTEVVRSETFSLSHDGVNAPKTKEFKNIPADWYYEVIEDATPGFNSGSTTTKTGTIEAEEEVEVDFVNDYAVTPVNAEITVQKAFLEGYQQFWIGSDSFEFQLIGNNEIIESKNATLSGDTVTFEREFENPGTYNYTVTEKTENEDGSSAFRPGVMRWEDDTDIEVTIEIVDDGEGALKVGSISYKDKKQTIYNLYEDTTTYGADGELEFTKVLEGRDWRSSDEFTFEITGSDGAPMPSETELTVKNSTEGHKVDFGTIEFSEQDVGNTYVYTVSEDFDVPSVEAKDGMDEIVITIEVIFNDETGAIDLEVSSSQEDNTFTNVYKTTEVRAEKVWDDDDDRDGLRKNFEGYFVAVRNDEGEFVDYDDLALEDKDDYEFSGLPEKNANGEVIEYEIVEASACSGKEEGAIECTEYVPEEGDDYTVTIKDGVITNFHEPKLYNGTGELTAQKIWDGKGNELVRPGTITIELYANGEMIDGPVAISEADEWKHTFTGLYLNEGGEPIEYTVQESKIGETAFNEGESVIVVYREDAEIENGQWEKVISGTDITNTWTRSLAKSLTIQKTVKGLSPEVLADLEFTIEGPEDFGEDGKMTLVVKDDCTISGEAIVCEVSDDVPTGIYTVTESNADVEHFELVVSGDNEVEKEVDRDDEVRFEITNEYEVEKVSYGVVKIWDDEHDKDGKRPEQLTIELLANGEVIETVDMSIRDAVIVGEEDEDYVTGDVWIYVWEGLPYADNQAEVISYTAEEILESSDYELTETESDEYYTMFVNTHEPEVDPCADGCGGDTPIVPPMKPDTGEITLTKDGKVSESVWMNNMIGGVASVSASVILLVANIRRRKVKLTK